MAVSIPMWRLGRHTTAITITGQDVAADGELSNGDVVNCVGVFEEFGLNLRASKEEINPANSTRENMVVVSDAHQFRISVIEVNNGSDPSPLHELVYSYDIFKVSYTHGTGASAKVITLYGSRGDYEEGTRGRGKQIASFTLDAVDAGSSTIVRT